MAASALNGCGYLFLLWKGVQKVVHCNCMKPPKSCWVFEYEEHDTSSSLITTDLLLDGWKNFNVFLCNTILFLYVSPSACFLRTNATVCPRARSLFVLHILHLNEVLSGPILSHILKSNSSLWYHSFLKNVCFFLTKGFIMWLM